MMKLDPGTMLVVEAFVLFLVGGLTFLASFQGRRDRTLLWAGCGMWLACAGFLLGVVRGQPQLQFVAVGLANMFLITAHACLWTSLNVFRGRPVAWHWLLAGAAAWLLLYQWPAFRADVDLRVGIYSVLTLFYIVAGLASVWPECRRNPAAASPLLVFLAIHALFYAYRVPGGSLPGAVWPNRPDFGVVMFEGLFFAICLSFGILMMVRARAEQNYRHAALHDALTGLPNRRALFERSAGMLAQARLTGMDVAVLMCDLDWFKQVNDRFGHEAGDRVLVHFAGALRRASGEGRLCARLGGEEFVVIAVGLGPLGAENLAGRIRGGLSSQTHGVPDRLTASVGIACSRQAGYDLDRLLARADQALYAAKTAGRDCIRVWPVAAPAAEAADSVAISRSGSRRAGEHPVDP
jgi:diguanylate cyclase (GGDEF)-like protein